MKDNQLIITADIVKKIKSKEIKWQDLLVNHAVDDSILEYIDPEEQNFAMIAMDRRKLTTMDK